MTVVTIEKIGVVAQFSEKGDWAFRTAFGIARSKDMQINIFYFIESPYSVPRESSPSDEKDVSLTEKELIGQDRTLREYYEPYLGDYEKVGFRVCVSARHNLELRQCLMHREYQLLVIPYIDRGVAFGNMQIEEFAYRFQSPVLLVGPSRKDEYHLNPAANLAVDALNIVRETASTTITTIEKPHAFQQQPVI